MKFLASGYIVTEGYWRLEAQVWIMWLAAAAVAVVVAVGISAFFYALRLLDADVWSDSKPQAEFEVGVDERSGVNKSAHLEPMPEAGC
ncbi:hypothetical protein [Bradyrhizobium sp. HKCCYLS20291]|uniref:hypothetical protein n=1 Tax=Bradyrhizobium sp. HKCCYLS20291 TaxID=3420766 RepID=UPI003EBFDD02